MKLNLEEMRDIAKTLPVGYYLGRKVPIVIEPEGGAYCDVVNAKIYIGLPLLQTAADHIVSEDAAKWSREALLRCLLYHEVGHLLLSPKWLGFLNIWHEADDGLHSDPDSHDLVNIFEDERLEQVLSAFFMGVDFKGFVRLVSKGSGGGEGSRTARFFDAVRLRRTTPEISSAVDDAIENLACLTASIEWGAGDYQKILTELVEKILPEEDKRSEDKKPDEGGKSDESKSGDDESDDGKSERKPDDGKPEGEKSEDEKSEDGKPDGESKDEKPEGEKPDEGESKDEKSGGDLDGEPEACKSDAEIEPRKLEPPEDLLKSAADRVFYDTDEKVAKVLRSFATRLSKKKGAQAAGCWSALHGRIEPRRDALDKERIFRRRSDVGDSLMSSVHLTLWIDVSGSFTHSVDTLNRILAAASKAAGMSGGKLNMDVVKMGIHATVADPREWCIGAAGGNAIDRTYHKAWKATRRKDRRNIDLVVFDGDAKSNDGGGRSQKMPDGRPVEQVIWNHPDCHIICDAYNRVHFAALDKAHVTYVHGEYAELLQDEVIKTLDRIL